MPPISLLGLEAVPAEKTAPVALSMNSVNASWVSASARQHARNDLPAVPPVDAEIVVRRQQHGIIQRLSHADKAGIRETHRHVGIFLQQLQDGIHVVGETIVAEESASAKQ
jgi:hypothetical protein